MDGQSHVRRVRVGTIVNPSYFILGIVQSKRVTRATNVLRGLTLPTISFQLTRKTYVAASYGSAIQRAVVCEDSTWNGKEWIHHLLLLDVGKFLDTAEAYQAPQKIFHPPKFGAFQFALDGVVPLCDEETCDVVASLLKGKKLESVINELGNDGLFIGDVLFGGKSLTEYLLQHNYAVSDSKRFAEFVPYYSELLNFTGQNTERRNSESSSADSFKTAKGSSSINDSGTNEESSESIEHLIEWKKSEISHSFAENIEEEESNTSQTVGSETSGSYRILVRKPADQSSLRLITSLRESSFTEAMTTALDTARVKNIFPVGAYALPAMATGQNTAVIDPKGQGKTFSSIIGVMDQLFRLNQDEIPYGNGPLAIFLCKSSKSAGAIYQQCLRFVSFCDGFMPKVKCIVGSNEEKTKVNVGNGCDVLISTPPCLVRILRNRIWTNLRRLRWLVIDEADELLEPPFHVELSTFRMILQNHAPQKIQRVVLARAWTTPVRKLVFSLDNPILLITCHLEASYYAKIQQTVHTVESDKKMISLIEWLKNRKKNRVAIVCSSSEVNEVAIRLSQCGLENIVAENDMDHLQLSKIKYEWDVMKSGLLVCCDNVLLLLKIYDATCLVNYSIPDQKDAYTYRYSLLMNNFRDHYQPNKPTVEVEALNFFDGNVGRQLPVLVKFFERFGNKVSPALLEMAQKIQIEQEELKRDLPLCDLMLCRGVCSLARNKISKCHSRHVILPEIDAMYEFQNREIVFHRVIVQYGAELWAHLISSEDAFGNKVNYFDLTEDIQKKLKEHYQDEREILGKAQVGALCAYFHDGEYVRAKILYLNADSITLRFIDSGLRKTVGKNTALMVMSEELREYPQQAVKMYMADLIPIDFDEMFDGQSSKRLQTLLNKPKEKTQQWRANIRIPFKSALIVDNVRLVSWIAGVERFVDTGITAARELFNNGLAIEDKNQLSVLTEMCTKAGFNLPSAPRKSVLSVKPKWAHLDIGDEECYPAVELSYVFNTNQVYVINKKFVSQLKEVEKLCQQEGDALLQQGLKYKIRTGNICLAKTDCGWNRAQVVQITEGIAQCYMVDHGDILGVELSNIVRITEKLVNQLPFQAIECILGGVKFSDSEEFVDQILENNLVGFYAKGKRRPDKPQLTKGPLYEISLLSFEGICLNRKLIDDGVLERDTETDSAQFLEDDEIIDIRSTQSEEIEDQESDDDLMEELFNRMPHDVKKQVNEVCKVAPEEALDKLLEITQDPAQQNIEAILEMSRIHDSPEAVESRPPEKLNASQPRPKETIDDISEMSNSQEKGEYKCLASTGLNAKVHWNQTEKNIIIKIMVPGVNEKTIWASNRHIGVKLINYAGNRYVAKINLFGMIHYQYIRTHIGPSSFDVYCPKMVLKPWPRLTVELNSNRNIKYNPDAIIVHDDPSNNRKNVVIINNEDDSSGDELAECQDFESRIES